MCKVLIVYYSLYGHIYKMALAVAEGVRAAGCEAVIKRVPETLPDEVLEKMGAIEAQKQMAHIPVVTVEDLVDADAIIFGTPTRFGNMCGQMRQFLDATGGLWQKGACRQGGERVYQLSHPAWRAGIHHLEFSYKPFASRDAGGRAPICICGTDDDRRADRLFTIRCLHHHRRAGAADAKRQ